MLETFLIVFLMLYGIGYAIVVALDRYYAEWKGTFPKGRKFTFDIVQEDGYYVGRVIELGVSSFGTSIPEALRATADATALYLEETERG